MILSPAGKKMKFNLLVACVLLSITSQKSVANIEGIQFNIDMLDNNDREKIDLSHFSQSGYIMPGNYTMTVHVNKLELPEQVIPFYLSSENKNKTIACLDHNIVNQLGLKPAIIEKLEWWNNGQCLGESSLPGIEIKGDLASSSLYINVPQAYLEYSNSNWDPQSRWEEGISGVLFDYNINGRSFNQQQKNANGYSLNGNGTAGINLGSWRLRADWQAALGNQLSGLSSSPVMDWTRYYAYKALPTLKAKLIMGEILHESAMFDSFRFLGTSLISDDNMLPPNLRGYAPEIVGVAKTNATVIISQQGRVLYETTVAEGPFRIQDISDSVSGQLNVRIEEQNGNVQEYVVNTASIPYLTRPGSLRFKVAGGRPSDIKHNIDGPMFASGEFSWGVSNGWSLYGGTLFGENYKSLSIGIGRDLLTLGALSIDATHSNARLSQNDSILSGNAYRFSYSKNFDEYDSQVTFAGYRFSEKEFMNMNEYLEAQKNNIHSGNSKNMYTVTFNKNFRELGLSTYVNYSNETYWDREDNNRLSVRMARYFDIGEFKNLSMSVSAYRNKYNGINDDGGYISLSMPLKNNATVSYNLIHNNDETTHSVNYFGRIDERSSYQLAAGRSQHGINTSGYYSRDMDAMQVNLGINYSEGNYRALSVNAQGGMTITPEGGAIHRSGRHGSTRMLVDSDGVSGIPIRGNGYTSYTNSWGKTVIGNYNHYYRNNVSVDLDKLSDNAEATKSVTQATLTEGAIGYRKFNIISGAKAIAVIKLNDGSEPPFGSLVFNSRQQETGIVTDNGNIYLSGINAGDVMDVHWNEKKQCSIHIPNPLTEQILMNTMLLPCTQTSISK